MRWLLGYFALAFSAVACGQMSNTDKPKSSEIGLERKELSGMINEIAPPDAGQLDQFWKVIELSRADDQDAQLAKLKAELGQLTPAQISQFAATMDYLLNDSYSWDLWGAAYVTMCGASDDSFEYFRVWMIAQGRDFFEQAQRDPDMLADLIPVNFSSYPDFELLAYVASEVWQEKTGEEEFPTQPDMAPLQEPSGEAFSDDPSDLAKRYPKLWARFGDDPLG